MPYTAFIDTTLRVQLFGVRGGTDTFWRYVGPHEVAHQWWGHLVGWTSYHDQWMSEGFAEFSTSLYVQFVRQDVKKFIEFWEESRNDIISGSPLTMGHKPYTIGPVTQGYRLNSARTGNVARFMIYPKGAYILHMLRMLMYDSKNGDTLFKEMMTDFIKSNFNKDVSTEDFKRSVEKHMTQKMDLDRNGKMDWFFNQWVYGTEIPSYQFEYKIDSEGTQSTLSGKITQSGVSDNFKMRVPLYVDFGKGWQYLGSIGIAGNSSVDLGSIRLPTSPKRAAISAMNDVLAISTENKQR
jgi:aminopeptidase N